MAVPTIEAAITVFTESRAIVPSFAAVADAGRSASFPLAVALTEVIDVSLLKRRAARRESPGAYAQQHVLRTSWLS
jgi:hypothetical protein